MTAEELQRLLDTVGPAWRVFLRAADADEPYMDWVTPRVEVLAIQPAHALDDEPVLIDPEVIIRVEPVFDEVRTAAISIPELVDAPPGKTTFMAKRRAPNGSLDDVIITNATLTPYHLERIARSVAQPFSPINAEPA